MPTPLPELESLRGLVGDRYHLQELLGKKSGRRTVLALDTKTNQQVVIKLLMFGEDFVWDDLKLFEREAETLRSLEHPQIPQYIDYFDVTGERSQGFALVQSYIEARSLSAQMEAGRRFSEDDLVEIAQQLLDILQYLHSCQPPVIHRDIKPSNILLTDRSAHSVGQAYLVDFGSVQTLAAQEGGTMTVVGTYGYMPPEQFGRRTVPASDLYALGATLIYLGSGCHPADLPQRNLRMQFEEVVSVGEGLKRWLRQLVEPDLEQRLSSVQEAELFYQEGQGNYNLGNFEESQRQYTKSLIHSQSEFERLSLPSYTTNRIEALTNGSSIRLELLATLVDFHPKIKHLEEADKNSHIETILFSILVFILLSIMTTFGWNIAGVTFTIIFFIFATFVALSLSKKSQDRLISVVNSKTLKIERQGQDASFAYDYLKIDTEDTQGRTIKIISQGQTIQRIYLGYRQQEVELIQRLLQGDFET